MFQRSFILTSTERQPKYIYARGQEVTLAQATVSPQAPDRVSVQERHIVRDQERAQALGFHFRSSVLYFSDTVQDNIHRGDPDTDQFRELTVNARHVEGMLLESLKV